MYKLIVWRYGTRVVIDDEFETIEEAVSRGEYGSDEGYHFFECVVDENDIIVYSDDYALGSYQREVGTKYIYD